GNASCTRAPTTSAGPALVTMTVYVSGAPGTYGLGWLDLVRVNCANVVMLVSAVLLLFAVVGSLTPEGGATVAALLMLPLMAAVPLTVSVTLPPAGSVGMASPACSCATVGDDGQIAPPFA